MSGEPRWRETPAGSTCRDCGGVGWRSCICLTLTGPDAPPPGQRRPMGKREAARILVPYIKSRAAERNLSGELLDAYTPGWPGGGRLVEECLAEVRERYGAGMKIGQAARANPSLATIRTALREEAGLR